MPSHYFVKYYGLSFGDARMRASESITNQLPNTSEIESRLAAAVREVNVLKQLLRIVRRSQKEAMAKGGNVEK